MKRLFWLPLLLAIAFTNINCNKEGPQGETGPAGPVGPTGPAGPVGTANIVYSAWFTADQNGGWVDTTINGVASQKKFRKSAPGVTLSILNNGLVLGYVKLNPDGAGGTTTSIRPLPYANPGTASLFMILAYVGNLTFANVSSASPGVAVPASSGGLEFRYLVVPGGVAGGRMVNENIFEVNGNYYAASELKAMSYEQVCSLFNIPE